MGSRRHPQDATHGGGPPTVTKQVQQLDRVIIRFAGDSGDGMQLTGDRFTRRRPPSATTCRRCPTSPPRSARLPAPCPGCRSFQLHFADHDILTPGDAPDVLVAMNPAALKANLADLPARRRPRRQHRRVHQAQPDQGRLRGQPARGRLAGPSTACTRVPLTSMTVKALDEFDITRKDAERAKNMFALGLLSWLYHRPIDGTLEVPRGQVRHAARDHEGQHRAPSRPAGTTARPPSRSRSGTRSSRPRCSRAPTGTSPATLALAYGLIAASQLSGLPLFLGSYPITPASDILHELSKHKRFGVRTFQAEDEIAGVGAALGAAFGGSLAVTATSGPGMILKAETVGLAVSVELPLIVCDIQRAGPSTGMPTKTEQADLLLAMFGRNGESPVPDRGPGQPVRLLRDGDRGGADRGHIPHPGVPAVRRLPGQRFRAVAASRRDHASRSGGRILFCPAERPWRNRRRGVPAVPAGSFDPGQAVGRAGHSRARTPDRRHREGRRHRGDLLRPRQP